MKTNRRKFLSTATAATAGAALSPLIRVQHALGQRTLRTRRVVVVAIGGGLRRMDALGMAQGATLPNLFGDLPLISGHATGAAAAPVIAPEYAAQARPLVLPDRLATPLHQLGTTITNLRYAEGAPGHLQGNACLVSGLYNNIENRADARLEVPTVFELHRDATGAAATDAWYISTVGGFYSALQSSAHPAYGGRVGGMYVSPPAVMNPIFPIITSGLRSLSFTQGGLPPAVPYSEAQTRAVARLRTILDGNFPEYARDPRVFRASTEDREAMREHLGAIFSDPTYQALFPNDFAAGEANEQGETDATADATTIFHAERILDRYAPAISVITMLDVDSCHADFNGYLRGQLLADALIRHLWEFIQSHPVLRDETALLVVPEHGRHLFSNGVNPDSLGRSGIDHGEGDDGDRDVFLLALGPDFRAGEVIAPTGPSQTGRTSGSYETIDVIHTAMALLGHEDAHQRNLLDHGARPGVVIEELFA